MSYNPSYVEYNPKVVKKKKSRLQYCITKCNTRPLVNRCLWGQVWQTSVSLVGEVMNITTLKCPNLPLCGSDTVLFGLYKPLNLNKNQGFYYMSKKIPGQTYIQIYYVRSILECIVITCFSVSSSLNKKYQSLDLQNTCFFFFFFTFVNFCTHNCLKLCNSLVK